MLSEHTEVKIKSVELGYALMTHMYKNRYNRAFEELEKYSKVTHDPDVQFEKTLQNSILEIEFQMHLSSLKIFTDEHNKSNKTKPIFYSVFEELNIKIVSETMPQYFSVEVALDNFFIRDFYSPQPALPFVVQTVLKDSGMNGNGNGNQNKKCLDIKYEIAPKDNNVASRRLKLYTYGQIYVYANLGFATTILQLLIRILSEMNRNFAYLIETSPEEIRGDINRGSFYQDLLEKVISKKQDELYQNLYDLAYGNYEMPSLDLDISFISPKIIINETLINEKLMDPSTTATVIVDLGTIQTTTHLIKKEKGYDYEQEEDETKLYDTTIVKFGKLRVTIDFKLELLNHIKSDREPNWSLSSDSVDITNDFNFGFEIKACLTPFHRVFPAQKINFKVQDLNLNISRKVMAASLRLYNLAFQGKFMKALNIFFAQPPPRPPEDLALLDQQESSRLETDPRLKEEVKEREDIHREVNKTEAKQQQVAQDETLLQSIKRIVFDTAVDEIKEQYRSVKYDEAKKAISIQLNFIFSKLTVILQEIEDNECEFENSHFSQFISPAHRKINQNIINRIEFGISSIKARFIFVPKTSLKFKFFLKRIYIFDKDAQSESEYKYLILNPITELDDDCNRSVSELSPPPKLNRNSLVSCNNNMPQSDEYKGKILGASQKLMNHEIQVDFHDFDIFNPDEQAQEIANQLFVESTDQSNNKVISIYFSNLRIVLVVPLVKLMFQFYIDVMIDMFQIQKEVTSHLKGLKTKRTLTYRKQLSRGNSRTTFSQSFVSQDDGKQSNRDSSNKKKMFNLSKKYTSVKESKKDNKEEDKGGKFYSMLTFAKKTSKFDDPKKLQTVQADEELQFEKRTVTFSVKINSSLIEILIPTNIYSRKSLALNLSAQFEGGIRGKTLYEDAYLCDKWKTWKGTTIESDVFVLRSRIKNLSMYIENQDDHDHKVQINEKLFFLHPYNLSFKMKTFAARLTDQQSCYRSELTYKGNEQISLQIGLKELNAYLILGQLIFDLINYINKNLTKMNDTYTQDNYKTKKELNQEYEQAHGQHSIAQINLDQVRQNQDHSNLNEQFESKKEDEEPQPQVQSLDEILINERLLKAEEERIKSIWKKGYQKAIDSIRKKNFCEFITKFKFKGIQLHFTDNTDHKKSYSLITLYLNRLGTTMEFRMFEALNNYTMENLFQIEKLDKEPGISYYNMECQFVLHGKYYNRNNYSEEPFLEKFHFIMRMDQLTPLSQLDQLFYSEDMLNINFSYGLASNLQRIIRTLLKTEQEDQLNYQSQLETPKNFLRNHPEPQLTNLIKFSTQTVDEERLRFIKNNPHRFTLKIKDALVPDNEINQLHHQINLDEIKMSIPNEFGVDELNETKTEVVLQNEEDEQKFLNEVKAIEFINKTGVTVKFCLSVFDKLLRSRYANIESNDIYVLKPDTKPQFLFVQDLENTLEKNFKVNYDKTKSAIKINFKFDGFKRVKNIILQKCGIFGYFLINEDRGKRDIIEGSKSEYSCIVRINRDEEMVQVFFESSLVLYNDSSLEIEFYTLDKLKNKVPFKINDKRVHNAPLTWLLKKQSLYLNLNSGGEHPGFIEDQIFKNMKKIFDPRIIKPYENHAKAIRVQDKYLSVDIFYLKTKTSVGQFLVIIQPLLTIANFLFTEISLKNHEDEKIVYANIKTNTVQHVHQLNPYLGKHSQFKLSHRADTEEFYEKTMHFDLKEIRRHKDTNLRKGFFVTLNNTDDIDHTKARCVQVAFEKLKASVGLKETIYDNFFLRKIIYKRVKSFYFKIYAPYIAINRTELCLVLHGFKHNQTMMINPHSSIMIAPFAARLRVSTEKFKESKPFLINTFGISGSLKLVRQLKPENDEQNIIDPMLDRNQKQIELGTYIGMCPHPYSSTKVIKFQPRYRIINRLDLPIVIREENCSHQIGLMPGDQMNFNLSFDDQNMIRIRLLNLDQEAKVIERDLEEQKQNMQTEQIKDINFLTSRKSSQDNGILNGFGNINQSSPDNNQHLQMVDDNPQLSRREALMNNEGLDNDLDASMQSKYNRYIELSKDYVDKSMIKNRKVWGYKFPINNIDDFQIALPNINRLPDKNYGWSINQEKFFVRVNISPAPENEATLFITFTQPLYPEYVFYNNTPTPITVKHQSQSSNQENDEEKLNPDEKRAICLNPNEKDEDYLIIAIFNQSGAQIHKFTYEIDSLRKQTTFAMGNYIIVTKMSGNLRFIHLMTLQQFEILEKQKYRKMIRKKWHQQQNQEQMERLENPDQHQIPFENSPEKNQLLLENDSEIKLREDGQQNDHSNNQSGAGVMSGFNDDNAFSFFNKLGGDQNVESGEAYQYLLKVDIKGIGISLIDHQPKEICYVSIYSPQFIQLVNYHKNKQGLEKTRRKLEFKVENIQVDNMTFRSFPVIFGPRKAFNFQESNNYRLKDLGICQSDILRSQNEGDQNNPEEQQELCKEEEKKVNCFMKVYLDHQITTEAKISSQRIKCFELQIAEIQVNFHQYFLNHLIQLTSSISQLLSNEDVTQFMNSHTMANYNKMMIIIQGTDDSQIILQDGRQSIAPVQGRFDALPPIEENSLNNNGSNLNSHNTRKSKGTFRDKFKTKEKICPFISVEPMSDQENQGFMQNKILAQEISIKAIRFFVTFRVSKIETPGNESMMTPLINFFTNFANVTDAQIYVSEIEIKNAYSTLESIQGRLTKHYIKEGIEQLYQVLGATDIIGNPIGLINNLGRGVEQFYSEPYQGFLTGDASKAAIGFGKGIKSLAANTTIGISNSISRLSGTWYISMKNLSGKAISESNLDHPRNIHSGIYQGSKGLVLEVSTGVAGLITKPAEKVREQGKGCIQVAKGTFQGVVGFVTMPLNGILRFVNSISTGIKNFASEDIDFRNQRFRYPRYFDDRDIMKCYDRLLSHAYTAICSANGGIYKSENIVHAFDVSGYIDPKKIIFKQRIFIITTCRVLFIQNLTKIKANHKLKSLIGAKIDVKTIQPKLNRHKEVVQKGMKQVKITFITRKKQYKVKTSRVKKSKEFVEELKNQIFNFYYKIQ